MLPDTPLVEEASAIVTASLDAEVLRHSKRAFLLGRAYAEVKRIAFDEEDLCLAALFHDVGLAPELRKDGVAFPLASSRELSRFLADHGVGRERAAPMVDAIAFHMQLFPRWKKGPIVGLLQVGAWMDATGRGRRALLAAGGDRVELRDAIAAIDAELPRGDFDRVFRRRLVASLDGLSACLGLVFPDRYAPYARLR